MTPLQYVLGILLVVCSLGLILAILGQSAKSKRLGGAITGGAETFLGKEKGKKADIFLNKLTIVLIILLSLLTIAMFVFQTDEETPNNTTSTPAATSTQESNVSQADVSDVVSSAESASNESEATGESVTD